MPPLGYNERTISDSQTGTSAIVIRSGCSPNSRADMTFPSCMKPMAYDRDFIHGRKLSVSSRLELTIYLWNRIDDKKSSCWTPYQTVSNTYAI